MRIAIIDCGTNTFNLLVADIFNKTWQVVFEDKIPVKIGKGGIENKTIVPEAFQRAIEAIKSYSQAIGKWNVDTIIATSTSAFRSTENGPELRHEIFRQTGIDIKIISGNQEAEYIYQGVTLGLQPEPGINYLIMDIGGGSTEFILYNAEEIIFKESYLLGASRLLEKFKPSDPLSNHDVDILNAYFSEQLSNSLIDQCKKNPPQILIGSSGFFDTLRKISFYKFNWANPAALDLVNHEISIEEFNAWYKEMLPMNLNQRMHIEGMTSFRAEMMGISMILVDFILNHTGVKSIINSRYALKEGILAEYLK